MPHETHTNKELRKADVKGETPRGSKLTGPLLVAGVVLAIGLAISFALWRSAESNLARATRLQFEASSSLALTSIQRRMEEYQTMVLGLQGLFIASNHIDRDEFRRYYINLRGQLQIPGIRALHFTRHVPGPNKAAFVAAVRNDRALGPAGFPDFAIHPDTPQAEYFVIEYIEPFADNRRAFGLDSGSQTVNRESFLAARDSGKTSLTQPFQLIQAKQGEKGLVLRAPVYRYGMSVTTEDERRAAFVGLVGISLNANDIFSDVLSESFVQGMRVVVHDISADASGAAPKSARLLIADNRAGEPLPGAGESALARATIIPVGGRYWEIHLAAGEDWLAHQQVDDRPELILATGAAISLLLAALYLALARSRTHAGQLALKMTRDLRQSEQRFRAIATMSTDWFWEQDTESRFVSLSGAEDFLGKKTPLPLAAIKGKTRWELAPTALSAEEWQAHWLQLAAHEPFTLEYPMFDQAGQERWVVAHGAPRFDDAGVFLGYHGTAHDITERKHTEVEITRKSALLQTTLENMSQGISVIDKDLRLTAFNRKFYEILDFPPQMIREGVSLESLFMYNAQRGEYGAGDHNAKVRELVERARNMQAHRFKRTRPNGRIIEVVGNVLPNGGFVTTYTDITEQERAEEALRASENRFRLMFERTADALLIMDPQSGYFVDYNQAAADMLRLPQTKQTPDTQERPRLHPVELSPALQPDGRTSEEKAREMVATALENGSHRFEWIHRSDYREDFPAEVLLTPVLMGDKRVIITTWRDITERKQFEEKLKLAASVFVHAREGITITDASGTIIEVNAAFTAITGYSRTEAVGQNPRILRSERQSAEYYAAMWRSLNEKGHWSGEIWNRRKNGEIYAEMLTISAVRDAAGKVQNYVALFVDITPIKEHQRQLEHIAHYDALTNLPNRVLLADRMQQAMAQCQRRNQMLAVVYLDLDGFKAVNDHHGHDVGDSLLITIAQRMKAALRDGDTLARIGGDEFVAVLGDLAQAQDCEPVLGRLLLASATPALVGEISLHVSASIGVTLFPQDAADADQLMRHADQAMYQAKQSGKNRYHLFDIAQDAAVQTRHESLEHIRRAIERQEFVLYYQPKVNMKTGAVIGVEALIRWQHPQRGLLSPAAFLPIIEDHPVSVEVGEWVIDTALAQIAAWRASGLDLPVSVNVGARQLQQSNFVSRLAELLAAHADVPAHRLELEVLETSALEDVAKVSDIMLACRELGVHFALDDFGTGYSSLTYLKRLPAGVLKIDQSFVRDMLDDPDDLAIIEGVIGLGKVFRRQMIAEGVESVAHGELLLPLGCELAQGYGIARPMPAADVAGWAAAWRPAPAWAAWCKRLQHRDDVAVVFAEVEHRHWLKQFESYLAGERDKPPPLDVHECRFGQWQETEGLVRHGKHPEFPQLVALHQRIHRLGNELVELHLAGRDDETQQRLEELHSLRDELIARLHALMRGASVAG